MIKVEFTVPVKFRTSIYADSKTDEETIYKECEEMLKIEQADILSYEVEDMDIHWETIDEWEDLQI